ncbi:oligosaccharide repeat unit polymerase [Gordonia soli]|uniref:Oligosaccharide repeat unit polymerase n=1 Tax=Gordonia soli NBRC 108243 TaxID=1223545 RepID=M0QIU8_9ACTN|nr:hypothetical protein GS4_16_00070 [Gordonia soli NBRC 108243]
MNPLWPAGLFIGVFLLSSTASTSGMFSLWRVPRYVDGQYALLASISALAFLIGLSINCLRRTPAAVHMELTGSAIRMLRVCVGVAFWLCLLGYVLWIGLALARGTTASDFLAVLRFEDGAIGALKRLSPPVAGVTTFAQLGAVAAPLMVLLRKSGIGGQAKRLTIVVALALFRSFFYGERLAIIEVVLPVLIIAIVVTRVGRDTAGTRGLPSSGPRSRFLLRSVPFLALPVIWVVFAVFEYSRSWLYYRNVINTSFTEYVSTRLVGYYATTANNGALYHGLVADRAHDPYFTFPVLWDAPFAQMLLGDPSVEGGPPRTWWRIMLENYGNPEFNNEGTFLVTDADLGTAASLVFWLVLGFVVGYVYHRARVGSLSAVVAYAVLFLGLVEISRIIYWVQGRFFPIAIFVVLVAFLLRSSTRTVERQSVSGATP